MKKGTLHKKPVTHYYNPKTGMNVIKGADDNFISTWKLSTEQQQYMIKGGDIGGQ